MENILAVKSIKAGSNLFNNSSELNATYFMGLDEFFE